MLNGPDTLERDQGLKLISSGSLVHTNLVSWAHESAELNKNSPAQLNSTQRGSCEFMSLNEPERAHPKLALLSCTIFLKFSATRKQVGRNLRYQIFYQNRSALSNLKGLTLDTLVRHYALNVQRVRSFAWGLMVVLQEYLAYA